MPYTKLHNFMLEKTINGISKLAAYALCYKDNLTMHAIFLKSKNDVTVFFSSLVA